MQGKLIRCKSAERALPQYSGSPDLDLLEIVRKQWTDERLSGERLERMDEIKKTKGEGAEKRKRRNENFVITDEVDRDLNLKPASFIFFI